MQFFNDSGSVNWGMTHLREVTEYNFLSIYYYYFF